MRRDLALIILINDKYDGIILEKFAIPINGGQP